MLHLELTSKALPEHPVLMHPRTGNPLRAIALRSDGRPVWPILGGAENDGDDGDGDSSGDDGDDGDGDSSGDDGDDDDDDKPLGPKGERALRAEQEKRRKATKRAQAEADRADAAERELAKLKKKSKPKATDDDGDDDTDAGDDVDEDTIRKDERAKSDARIVKSEVRRIATDLFIDPSDAPRYLDLSEYSVDDDGDVDEAEIKADLEDVLKDKPHLGKKVKGEGDGGPRRRGRKKSTPGVGRMRDAYAKNEKKR